MKKTTTLVPEFVEFIPDDLREGIIYVSMTFATAAHKCCCGCGREVVTPLSPADWTITYNGEAISLDPSIGNWSFPCKSHYWVRRGRVRWARPWSEKEVAAGRQREVAAQKRLYVKDEKGDWSGDPAVKETLGPGMSLWQKVKRWMVLP